MGGGGRGRGRKGRGSVRKHCKVICRGVSRENREVLISLVPSRSRDAISAGMEEERKRGTTPRLLPRDDAATHGCRTDGWMDGRICRMVMVYRRGGFITLVGFRLARAWNVQRSHPRWRFWGGLAAARKRGAVKNCGVCPDGLWCAPYTTERQLLYMSLCSKCNTWTVVLSKKKIFELSIIFKWTLFLSIV